MMTLFEMVGYEVFEKRKILVIEFPTPTNTGETAPAPDNIVRALTALNYDNMFYKYDDPDMEKRWENDSKNVCGIILSGSSKNTTMAFHPAIPTSMLNSGIPFLGICFGHEYLGTHLGAKLINCNGDLGEHDSVLVGLKECDLFHGIETDKAWMVKMNHYKMLDTAPPDSIVIADTQYTPCAGFYCESKKMWGVQFHPENDWCQKPIFTNFRKYCYDNIKKA